MAPDTPELDAWGAIVSIYQSVLHELVNVLEREVGMDSGVFSALAYLERAVPPHRMRMSELQRLLHPRYSQPGFSRLVSRMETDGLVAREPDPDDGRAVQIVTTRAGRNRYQRASDVYTPEVRRLVGQYLSADQCRALVALLASGEVPAISADALVASARARVGRLAPGAAAAAAADGALLVDLRPLDQRQRDGDVPGAVVVGRNVLEWRLDPASAWRRPELADADRPIVLFCCHGEQSSLAAATVRDLGHVDVADIVGGFTAWEAAGLPIEPFRGPSPEERDGPPRAPRTRDLRP